jgi:pyrimidine-specific ribonucleoside hydrolase
MKQIIFEMETSDPDDFMTMLWLADHPEVDLLGVLVTPGSKDQCQLVRWGLDRCGKTATPIGALHGPSWWASADGQKARVSGFHSKAYGGGALQHALGEISSGPALLAGLLHDTNTTVLVGSPPKNTGKMLNDFPATTIARWVQQGGFAGDNLVAAPLEKFKGRVTCPSFNPGGASKETLALLASPRVHQRLFVSKNVCHDVVWTPEMQSELKRRLTSDDSSIRVGMAMMIDALDLYLEDRGSGKAMHDLVAAACVLDESVCEFKEVEIYREKGEWGAREASGTNTRISVGFNQERFVEVLAR